MFETSWRTDNVEDGHFRLPAKSGFLLYQFGYLVRISDNMVSLGPSSIMGKPEALSCRPGTMEKAPTQRPVRKEERQPTLAEIKRRAKEEAEEARDDGHAKRFQTLNFSSENSRQLDEPDLRPLYCAVCGHYTCVLEGDLTALPTFESCYVVETTKTFCKTYWKEGSLECVRRPDGIETRQLYCCAECRYPLAYNALTETAAPFGNYLYIFQDSLVPRQLQAAAVRRPTLPL